jgi:chaperonin cofactor prefoldin
MEFGIRELVQFGTLLASLAGAFAVVKSQLSRVIQDIAQIEKVLTEMNTRIDQADADRAVIKHQNKIFGTILSPNKLEEQHREISELKTEMRVVHKNLDALAHMHNGRHPVIKGD